MVLSTLKNKVMKFQMKILFFLLIFVIFYCALLGFRVALDGGAVWDDPTELNVFGLVIGLEHQPFKSYQMTREFIDRSSPGNGFYGVIPQYLSHGLETIVTGKPWIRAIDLTLKAVAYRHVVAWLLALLSVLVLSWTVTRLAGNRFFGLCVAACLISNPIFLGTASINIKDTPVAVGLTFLSCGIAFLVQYLFRNRLESKLLSMGYIFVLICFGTWIAVGARAGALALIGFELAAFWGVVIIFIPYQWKLIFSLGFGSITAVIVGCIFAIISSPLGRKDILTYIIDSISFAAKFPTAVTPIRLFALDISSNHIPFWYIPGWLLVEHPEPFLVFIVIGSVVGLIRVLASPKRSIIWATFIIQGLLLPLAIIMADSSLYDRIRHVFFIIPMLGVLAGFGLFTLLSCKRYYGVAVFLGFLLFSYQVAITIIWHPYQYAHLNAIGRLFDDHAFDTDFMGLSMHEGIQRVASSGIKSFSAGPAPVIMFYNQSPFNLKVDLVSPSYSTNTRPKLGGGTYFIHARPSWGARGLPSDCKLLFNIRRQGVLLGYAGVC